jgi:hypothetical protein
MHMFQAGQFVGNHADTTTDRNNGTPVVHAYDATAVQRRRRRIDPKIILRSSLSSHVIPVRSYRERERERETNT